MNDVVAYVLITQGVLRILWIWSLRLRLQKLVRQQGDAREAA